MDKEKVLCPKHPTYRAIREPKANCPECWAAWVAKICQGAKVVRAMLSERSDDDKVN